MAILDDSVSWSGACRNRRRDGCFHEAGSGRFSRRADGSSLAICYLGGRAGVHPAVFLLPATESLLGHRRAALFAATLFAVVHIPSPVLTLLSFIGGLLFCELFHRYRNLVPIGLVHALLGLTIAASLPDSLMHHMRVGIGYLSYHP